MVRHVGEWIWVVYTNTTIPVQQQGAWTTTERINTQQDWIESKWIEMCKKKIQEEPKWTTVEGKDETGKTKTWRAEHTLNMTGQETQIGQQIRICVQTEKTQPEKWVRAVVMKAQDTNGDDKIMVWTGNGMRMTVTSNAMDEHKFTGNEREKMRCPACGIQDEMHRNEQQECEQCGTTWAPIRVQRQKYAQKEWIFQKKDAPKHYTEEQLEQKKRRAKKTQNKLRQEADELKEAQENSRTRDEVHKRKKNRIDPIEEMEEPQSAPEPEKTTTQKKPTEKKKREKQTEQRTRQKITKRNRETETEEEEEQAEQPQKKTDRKKQEIGRSLRAGTAAARKRKHDEITQQKRKKQKEKNKEKQKKQRTEQTDMETAEEPRQEQPKRKRVQRPRAKARNKQNHGRKREEQKQKTQQDQQQQNTQHRCK